MHDLGRSKMRSSQLLSRPVDEMLREIDEDVVQDDEDVEMTSEHGATARALGRPLRADELPPFIVR